MAGTWMTLIKGFGGMRVNEERVSFEPFIPEPWEAYSFKIRHRGRLLEVNVKQDKTKITNHSNETVEVEVNNKVFKLTPTESLFQ